MEKRSISKKTLASLFTVLALVSFTSLVHAQPLEGNWVVTGVEVVESKMVLLNGNLIIRAGGSLTLKNVTLRMNVEQNGQYGISVEEGGSMFIYNCSISSTTKNKFSFVAKGSSFVMKNTELDGVGWCPTQDDYFLVSHPDELSHSGLMVMTDNATIEDNIFLGNTVGLVMAGSYLTVARNLFINNTVISLFVYYNHDNTVVNNTFLQNPASFGTCLVQLFCTENNTFLGNTLNGNIAYFFKYSLIQSLGRMDGFNVYVSHGNEYLNNCIAVPQIPIFIIHSDDSEIIGNKMNYGEMAVNILTGVNTRIEGNEITTLQDPHESPSDWTGGQGIAATLAHNSVIANNTITGRAYSGISLSHTSNSSILNNNISLTRLGGLETMLGTVVFVGSRNNSVIGNTMSGSEFGMILTGSSDGNLITQNNILTDHSISITGSSSNRIFLNNLYDFREPFGGPYDNGMNFWYSGEDGNYWGHFTSRNAEGGGIGDESYTRRVVPPNGTEPCSLLTPIKIAPSPIPQIKPIPRPKVGSKIIEWNIISNQVMEIGWGDFPNNVTIVNSILFLGKEGLVRIGCPVSIINSTLINMGYGFSFGGGGSFLIKNSTIEGAFLDDMNLDNITIIDSTILDSIGVWGISVARSSSVVIVNNTFSGGLGGICTYSGLEFDKCLISGNRIYNMVDRGLWAGGNNMTIADNTIVGCNMGTGILIRGPNDVVRGNNISNVRVGLDFQGGGHIIYENNVVNTLCPLFNWGGGLVYHNNFVNYSSPLYDEIARIQELSHDGEGNYWSSYIGEDMDFDGIGDTPFVDGVAQDHYPFMAPNGWQKRFWLTVNTNFPSIPFNINGTSFSTSWDGSKVMQLGYATDYVFSFPTIIESVQSKFSLISLNGTNSNEMIVYLSSNATLVATYAMEVDVDAPVADAGPDQKVNVGSTVNFDAGGSSDDVGIVSYEWNFGDGTLGTGETATHEYIDAGDYTVTLIVKDAAGNQATNTMVVTVKPKEAFSWWIAAVAGMVAAGIPILAILWRRHR